MTSEPSPLVVDNLSFRYRDRQGAAIHNISFEANAGEVLLIAGASGCGKTTLVRCINGLIPRSYKFAYAMDLTMRFIPTFGRDFQLTMDAQRARGYELEKIHGGLIEQVRRLGPVVVPVTIHAIMGSEDIIDAMDLRAFGVGPRTWLDVLTYHLQDRILIIFGVLMLVTSIVFAVMGYGKFWAPEFLIAIF